MALTDGAVAIYNSDDFLDTSGNGNNGIPDGAIINTVDQHIGSGCWEFDGDDEVDCGSDISLDITGDITLARWVNLAEIPPADPMYIYNKRTGLAGNISYGVQIRDGGKIGFNTREDPGAGFKNVITTAAHLVAIDTWYLVAISVTGGVATIYFNGLPVLDNGTSVYSPLTDTSGVEMVCGSVFKNGSFSFLKGLLDVGGIWNRVLLPAEHLELWNDGAGIKIGAGSSRRRRMMANRSY